MVRNKVACRYCEKPHALSVVARHEAVCATRTDARKVPVSLTDIATPTESGDYACHACGKVYGKNGISTHYWLNHSEEGRSRLVELKVRPQPNTGKAPWNAGLTSNTDERVRRSRETLARNIALGVTKPGKQGKPLSAATKEKISEARAKYLNEQGSGGFKSVKWFKTVDSFGNECSLRGTWEVKVAEWLNLNGVRWTRRHYLKYFDGTVNRTYAPDFFIPEDNLVIEVKGFFSERDKAKMRLVQEQNPQTTFKMLFEQDIQALATTPYSR